MPRSPRALLAAALLAGCAGAPRSPAPGGGGDGDVALRFAWPEPFRVRMSLRHETHRTAGQPTGAIVAQILAVEPHGKELWVVNRDSEGQGNEPDLALNLRVGEALVQVVTPRGAFVRAEGLDEAVALLARENPDLDRDSVRRALARSAADDWEVTVGAWNGQRFRPGERRHRRVDGSLPLVSGIAAALDVEYGLRARVPCEAEVQPRCVELSWIATLAPGDRGGVLERLRAGMDPAQGTLQDVSARSETTLVSEPDTLVPHRMTVRQELRIRVRAPDGDTREVEERAEDQYRFEAEVEI